jgi:hypothetical protein
MYEVCLYVRNVYIIINYLMCCRFIVAPLMEGRPRAGPASRVYYPLTDTPGPNHHPQLRLDLSNAFSRTFLLEPHAIVRAFLEKRSYLSYQCPEAVSRAELLYRDDIDSPKLDLRRCHLSVYSGWINRQKTSTLQPNK